MRARRYKVSLVGFEEPAAAARPRRLARVTHRARRLWSRYWSLSWQLRAALLCLLVGAVILALHFS